MAVRIINADVLDGLAQLPDESVHCVVTSVPYYALRDYGTAQWHGGEPDCAHEIVNATRTPWANEVPGPNGRSKNTVAGHWKPKEIGGHCAKCGAVRIDRQIGLEPTLGDYLDKMVDVFREVRRALRKDGTCWLNIGDSYAGSWGAQGHQGSTGEMASRSVSSARQIAAAAKRKSGTGSLNRAPGLKSKDLMMVPARLAIALQDDGWWLRQEIIWHKPNPMPESVQDRCTKAHEHLFLLAKSERYFFDAGAIREEADFGFRHNPRASAMVGRKAPSSAMWRNAGDATTPVERGQDQTGATYDPSAGRNKRSVWTIATQPFPEAHFATFPEELPATCIKAGCPAGGTVLDPFGGAGTTGLVADRLGRDAILIELNPEYAAMAERRIKGDCPMFADVEAR